MTEKLKDIRYSYNSMFKYSNHNFKNGKEWPVHKIYEYAFYNCNEEDRRKIEADVISRGSGTLFKRYWDKLSKLAIISEERFNSSEHYAYISNNKCDLEDGSIGYLMPMGEALYVHYLIWMETLGIREMMYEVKTEQEAITLIIVYLENINAISNAPKEKTFDSNASRKGIVTRKSYVSKFRRELVAIMQLPFSTIIGEQVDNVRPLSKTRANKLINKLLQITT